MAEGLYVYAIVAGDTRLPDGLRGLMGDPLTMVQCRDLAAVASLVTGEELRPHVETVMRHEEIVEAVWKTGRSLPVRFGTVLPDADAVERSLSRRYSALVADLARLGGTLEFGLSILRDQTERVDVTSIIEDEQSGGSMQGPGAAYLRRRAGLMRREDAERARAAALADTVDAVLAPFALERRQSPLPTARLALRMAYLLAPHQVDAFKEAFEDVRRTEGEYRFLLSGPWPPYSFVSRDDTLNTLLGSVQVGGQGRAWSVEAVGEAGTGRHEEV